MHPQWKSGARVLALLVVGSLAACKKPVAEESEPAAQTAEATPAPASAAPRPPIAAATPEPNYFAPPGVYFLVAAVSVETAEGIVGLKPGTRLQKTAAGKYTADGHQLELRDQQVTNDLRVAQRVVGADQAVQAAIRKSMQAAEAAAAARIAAVATPVATPNPVRQSAAPAASRPASTLGTSAIGAGGLGASGAFGRTKTQDGWIWELDANGNWQPVRPDR